ncbi:hypothetical protein QMZ30_11680 [Pantoea sp. EA-12]|uniref:hypothetical protein n=1 Tax=Pantoea sp. EA-12 TaxID=3043303 RepID=UPI0024B50B32|nr:hypothetical protein [Pantoea sp. EA-12]MDI9221558.1 hypothetical protein [Pantoea sp. EA-12]
MQVNEEKLLRSGFSQSDIRKVKNNLESYGGTLDHAIRDLSRRFIIALSVVSCGIAVATFIQPPLLSYKSWRYMRVNKG